MNPAILVVDDEQSICTAVKRTLKKENFDVYTANSGPEALKFLQNQNIDLIISDQNMPGMKGTELLSIVKKNLPSVGRIILSGQSDQNDLCDAINQANINFFIQKPWNNEQLIDKIKENINLQKDSNVVSLTQFQANKITESFKTKINSTETYNQISLEQAIKNNRLLLSKISYENDKNSTPLCCYRVEWPEIPRFKHNGIINMADQAGFLHELFLWYLSEIDAALEEQEPIIIDIFFESILSNEKIKDFLLRVLNKRNNLILRVPIATVQKQEFSELLPILYKQNHSIALNIANSVVRVEDFLSTPISHVEMDNSFHSMNNSNLTEKRLIMNKEAENTGIKTILSSSNAICSAQYPIAMNFNYYETD